MGCLLLVSLVFFALGLEVLGVGAGFPGAFLGLGLAVWNFFSNSVKFLLAILVGHGFVGWVWVVGWLSWFGSGLVIFFGIDFLVVVESPLCCKRWNAPSCFMKICWFFCGCGFDFFFSLGFNFNGSWFSGLVGSESLGIFILGLVSWFLFLFGVGILVGKFACGLGFVLGFAGSIVPPATSVLGLVILACGLGPMVAGSLVPPATSWVGCLYFSSSVLGFGFLVGFGLAICILLVGLWVGFAGSRVPPATLGLGFCGIFSGMGLGVSSACVQPLSAFCSAWPWAPSWPVSWTWSTRWPCALQGISSLLSV